MVSWYTRCVVYNLGSRAWYSAVEVSCSSDKCQGWMPSFFSVIMRYQSGEYRQCLSVFVQRLSGWTFSHHLFQPWFPCDFTTGFEFTTTIIYVYVNWQGHCWGLVDYCSVAIPGSSGSCCRAISSYGAARLHERCDRPQDIMVIV